MHLSLPRKLLLAFDIISRAKKDDLCNLKNVCLKIISLLPNENSKMLFISFLYGEESSAGVLPRTGTWGIESSLQEKSLKICLIG